ncbi:hypothetical protein Bealeia1_00754 [Candidatus Bealeia paramacronuclearis]|uniref:Uncharacterized protein n=1 Tax=Candidatus Bealeia paramacronuclearis TaxID=1921001 RepID=A0ABZ2C483_9PROT|nr:hypothetical protein [Candidatus Bealeia paramacronuclearis]
MTKVFYLSIFFIITTSSLGAYVPECPYFNNKKSCLQAVDENYDTSFEYIREDYFEDSISPLIEAALDIKKLESLACEKTCYN